MGYWLSEPIEELIGMHAAGQEVGDCDVLIVGSGYGGAMAGLRLAGALGSDGQPLRVWLFERGMEYALGDFPESLGELPGHVRLARSGADAVGRADALFDLRHGDPLSVLVGNGLGGTSLINANVALEPDPEVFRSRHWPAALQDKAELDPSFRAVRELLGVDDAEVQGLTKFAALQRVAESLSETARPAPIAVTKASGPNFVGVAQDACIRCGNCVTGCNHGAKNTLMSNVLPLACSRGLRIYTGATVSRVTKDTGAAKGGWRVHFQRSAQAKDKPRDPKARESFEVHAGVVVLAAGTLGSTEILLRSGQNGLVLSPAALGRRFSANGDMIAFGYGQATGVNATAHADFAAPPDPATAQSIGPTISGYFRTEVTPANGTTPAHRITVQDGAVPSALASLFGEIVTTAALPARLLSSGALAPAWFDDPAHQDKDPLAVHPGALQHTQVLLAQGDDGAPGVLRLRPEDMDPPDPARAGVEIVWTPKPRVVPPAHDPAAWDRLAGDSVFAAIDATLDGAARKGGFDGGDHLANPLWRLLPEDLKQISKAVAPGHRLASVHPLGGCPMGDDRDGGVVNHTGQVFDGDGGAKDAVHQGLYVFDGAIVPGAVAVNPFLTIAALAYRNAGLMLEARTWTESKKMKVAEPALQTPARSRTAVPPAAHRVSARFCEQLMGQLESVPRWLRESLGEQDERDLQEVLKRLQEEGLQEEGPDQALQDARVQAWLKEQRWHGASIASLDEDRGLVARIEIDFDNVHGFLRDTRKPLAASCSLYANPALTDTVPAQHLGAALAKGVGSVEILAWDQPANDIEEWRRVVLVLAAFLERRGLTDLFGAMAAARKGPLRAAAASAPVEIDGGQAVAAVEVDSEVDAAQADAHVLAAEALLQHIEQARSKGRPALEHLAQWLLTLAQGGASDLDAGQKSVLEVLEPLLALARHHAQWRTLRYTFALSGPGGAFMLEGTKELAYAPGKPNPWTALVTLPVSLRDAQGRGAVDGELRVDLIDLTRKPALQLTSSPDTPTGIGAMASFGMMFVRALLQTHLFTFRTPDYPEARPTLPPDFTPQRLLLASGRRSPAPLMHPLNVPSSTLDPNKAPIRVWLSQYRPAAMSRGSILLVHGFAHGSSLFSTDTIPVSLASFLYSEGYDVWLLDHRLSNTLPDTRPGRQGRWLAELPSTIDEVAQHDIAAAVDYVYQATGAPVPLLAHCIGSAAVSMAVLAGYCHDSTHQDPVTHAPAPRSKISSLALAAVPPWQVPSAVNRLRANLAAFLRDVVQLETLNPIPSAKPGALEVLVDSLCASIPWPTRADAHRHESDAGAGELSRVICARYNAIYGVEWNHTNLALQTHRRIHELAGMGSLEIFQHIYFMALHQRITARDGSNRYLTSANLQTYWTFPTLFAHGADNGVFSALSSVRSFIRLSLELRPETADVDAPADQAHLFVAPGLGHLDFFFGKDARQRVYPYLEGFFRRVSSSPDGVSAAVLRELDRQRRRLPFEQDPHWRPPARPLSGPVIGWSRPDAGGGATTGAKLRVWMEAPDDTTTPPLRITAGPGVPPPTVVPLPKAAYPGQYFVHDLQLDSAGKVELGLVYDDAGKRGLTVWNMDLEALLRPSLGHRASLLAAATASNQTPVKMELGNFPWFQRNTSSPAKLGEHMAFVVGSCRYPGSPFERDLSDAIFGAVLDHVEQRPDGSPGIDHLLLVGDQIYADATADIFDTRDTRERFASRYREMLQSPRMARLVARVPVHMAIDDHEIENDWPGSAPGAPTPAPGTPLAEALVAATAYAWSAGSRLDNPGGLGLWSHFESGGIPFFVLDTRSRRELRQAGKADQARLMDDVQCTMLLKWLSANARSGRPQFVVSGSAIAPLAHGAAQPALRRNDDGWIGYPATLETVLTHILCEKIDNVVFVAGGPHFSASATLDIGPKGGSVRAHQIVSSGLFAPIPFANERVCDYAWDTQMAVRVGGTDLRVEQHMLSDARQQFMRVDAALIKGAWRISLQVLGVDGRALASRQLV